MGAHLAEPLPAQAPRGLARATSRRAWLARAALVGAAYVVSGRLGLELAHAQDNATLFWPPTGIALAALLALGWRVWPVVALSALGVNLMIGTPPLAALGIAIGNTAEALVAVFLLARMGFRPTFDAHRHVLGLVLAAAVGALVAALVGAGVLYLAGLVALEQTASVALVWWLGDVGGAIVIAPLALLAFSDGASWRALAARAESWIVFGATAASAFVAFGGLVPPAWSLFVAFLPFPFLVWSGLALGPRGAVVNATLVALVAVIGTAKGHGPFVHEEAGVRLRRSGRTSSRWGARPRSSRRRSQSASGRRRSAARWRRRSTSSRSGCATSSGSKGSACSRAAWRTTSTTSWLRSA